MAGGSYPVSACTQFIQLIESVEHNARFKGLNANELRICHLAAQKAGNVYRYQRQGRRHMKYTHVEIVVEEAKAQPKEEKKEKSQKKAKQEKE